jgi:hypothetical protein
MPIVKNFGGLNFLESSGPLLTCIIVVSTPLPPEMKVTSPPVKALRISVAVYRIRDWLPVFGRTETLVA